MSNYSSLIMKGAMLSIGAALLIASGTPARSQGNSRGAVAERDRNLQDREMQITLMEKGGGNVIPKREPRLLLQEINDDFARLQVVNNEMKRKSSTEIVLDFKYVSESAAEIKKRSSRLRTNLVFPESAKDDKREKSSPTEGLKAQLLRLDRLIREFVTNPVFTEAGAIDAELAAKARGDLDEIIDLSDVVKKHAADLNKSKPNSH